MDSNVVKSTLVHWLSTWQIWVIAVLFYSLNVYLLHPVMGSTAPLRGILKVTNVAKGHVMTTTSNKKRHRRGNSTIPKSAHWREGERDFRQDEATETTLTWPSHFTFPWS